MDTIVLILRVLTAFKFLLKQTFWKPVAVGAAAGIATIFVILTKCGWNTWTGNFRLGSDCRFG